VSPLDEVFTRTRSEGRAGLVGYLPAGYPDLETSVLAMSAMVDGGVDVVEVGLPYSDPLLDGPMVQKAVEVALRQGVTTADVMTAVGRVSTTGAPTLVMSYWNPIERHGVERFAADLSDAGGAGVITADITPEEAGAWITASDSRSLARVFLVAPSSSDARIAVATNACRGFVYAAAVMGVTGMRDQVGAFAKDLVERTKRQTDLPVCVGLGVSSGAQAAEVADYADGVIVGSAFVAALSGAPDKDSGIAAVGALARELAEGVRRRHQMVRA
jgi:tryptophan synthase alpha chain